MVAQFNIFKPPDLIQFQVAADTIVVMYTLKRSKDGLLEGPVNKKVY